MPFRTDWATALRNALSGGPRTARELAGLLGVSQATFSRLAQSQSDELLVAGRARATRYALRRRIEGIERVLPIYEIDNHGATRHLASLHLVASEGFYVEPQTTDIDPGFFRGIPYFLDGMRPSGFLGRRIPTQFPTLGFPQDILHWSGNHCMRYFALCAWDAPGNLIVGDDAYQIYLQHALRQSEPIPHERALQFDRLAVDALAGAPPGSSAAGEQPKFLTDLRDGGSSVLVKFSPPIHQEVGRRVADLLIAEHLALDFLARHDISAASSEIVDGELRRFLQVRRFDRTVMGRRGVISLAALDHEYVGNGESGRWVEITTSLLRQGIIQSDVLPKVAFLSAFGELIGNTDMHGGNLAFFTRGTRVEALAPAFDMLPMLYMPQHGHLVDRPLTIRAPNADTYAVWSRARDAAEQYYEELARHPLVSREFSALAASNALVLRNARPLAARLPKGN